MHRRGFSWDDGAGGITCCGRARHDLSPDQSENWTMSPRQATTDSASGRDDTRAGTHPAGNLKRLRKPRLRCAACASRTRYHRRIRATAHIAAPSWNTRPNCYTPTHTTTCCPPAAPRAHPNAAAASHGRSPVPATISRNAWRWPCACPIWTFSSAAAEEVLPMYDFDSPSSRTAAACSATRRPARYR